MRCLLLRHGQTEANQARRLSGQAPDQLSYEGRWQAIRAGVELRGQPRPDLLLCSDLGRARQTAAALAAAAGWPLPGELGPDRAPRWVLSPALRERDLGEWQGRSYDELKAQGLTERLIRWEQAPPGGESLAQLCDRVLGFLAQLPPSPCVIVSHAGPLRVLLGLQRGLERQHIGPLKVPNATPLRVELPARGWAALAVPRR